MLRCLAQELWEGARAMQGNGLRGYGCFRLSEGGGESIVFFQDVSQLFPTAATNLPCAYSSQALVGPPCSLFLSGVEAEFQGDGNRCQGRGDCCMGPGGEHLIATGQGHAEAWSSCPTPCSSAGRGRQHRERLPASPQLPLPQGVGPVAPSFQSSTPWDISQFWARPGRRGQPGPVQARASRSTVVSGLRQ